MQLELKKDDLQEAARLIYDEATPTETKWESIKSLLKDMFNEVIVKTVVDLNEATAFSVKTPTPAHSDHQQQQSGHMAEAKV